MTDSVWQERIAQGMPSTQKPSGNKSKPWGAKDQSSYVVDDTFQRDRARIIHSSSLRRLQGKTQIVSPHQSDFYRTRLTHSLEVAQIGSGLIPYLVNTEYQDVREWLPSMFLIEAICFAHDIGHPPFGHGGESALNYMMRHYGGFEGNAQTLRILCRLGEYHATWGLNLSRRTLLGVIKYPQLRKTILAQSPDVMPADEDNPNFRLINQSLWRPAKCLYDEDEVILNWLLQPFSENDRTVYQQIVTSTEGYASTQHKSLDTSIMDLADDIAYGIHDLEDGIAIRMLDQEDWQEHVMEHPDIIAIKADLLESGLDLKQVTKHLFDKSSKRRKMGISQMVSWVMQSAHITRNLKFSHPLLEYNAALGELQSILLKRLKRFAFSHLISRSEIKTLEYKGQQIVMELFQAYEHHPQSLLPRKTYQKYLGAQNLHKSDPQFQHKRLLSDYISGMSNDYATKAYVRIFTPYEDSIFDV